MNHTFEDKKLTLFLEGELNSYNSEDVEKELESLVQVNHPTSVVLDLEKLHYISSAGLRIIVRLKQQIDDTTLVKVPGNVYEIFDMVGFQNVLKIERL
ncbi:MAG: STAS domain-containing protein [Bacilli bacterium]|nr:STAS domain-containing protein [Bacilli bacterium]